ncbi:MAG: ion channel [Victivallales bacterium]
MINFHVLQDLKYRILLGVLILMLAVYPLFAENHLTGVALDVFMSFLIIFVVYESSKRKHSFAIAVSISCLALIANWSDDYLNSVPMVIASQALSLLFILYINYVIIMAIICTRRVTSDIVYGAVCVYILIGLMWTFFYSLLELRHPGSFKFSGNIPDLIMMANESPLNILSHLNYFSFETLATIGYGDIVPITHAAQMLSVFEAITGQIYLTVVIARFVGLYINHQIQKQEVSD